MEDCHPNQEVVNGISKQLANAHLMVRQLYWKGDAHLNQIKRILGDGKGLFPCIMADMKMHAMSVVEDSLAVEMSLQKAMDDTKMWCMNTSPFTLASLVLPSDVGDNKKLSDEENIPVVQTFHIRKEFRIGMLVD